MNLRNAILILFIIVFSFQLDAVSRQTLAKDWIVESESPGYKLLFIGDTIEITAPKGLTLWRKEKMSGNTAIEYDACVMTGQPGDRLSDLNAFWMAQDPLHPDNILARAKQRQGVFLNCYTLRLYYLGFGGNHNTTTRFRRYDGDPRGVTDPEARPHIIKEYTDPEHLLKEGQWYHIKITCKGGRTQYFINGERLVDYLDPDPLTEGWFGFRTTLSRVRIANFRYTCQPAQPSEAPLHFVGAKPDSDRGYAFGVPFDKGAVSPHTDLLLLGSDGKEIPSQTWPMAWWQDGSVKWMAMAATVPGGADGFRVKIAETKVKRKKMGTERLLAAATPDGIRVSTGAATAFIPRQGNALIDSILLNGVRVAANCRLVCSTQSAPCASADKPLTVSEHISHIDSVAIERNGEQYALIRISGHHQSPTTHHPTPTFPFTVRLAFHRGIPEIGMTHTFIYDGDQDRDFIRSLGVCVDVPFRREAYNRHAAFAMPEGGVWSEPVQPLTGRRILSLPGDTSALSVQERQMIGMTIPPAEAFDEKGQKLISDWAQWDGYRLTQPNADGFAIRKRALPTRPWIGTYGGTRAPGYAFLGDTEGGLGIFMKDFWQSYPSSLEISGARSGAATLTAWLWSQEAEPMDLRHYDERAHDLNSSYEDVQEGMSTPFGIARTSELILFPTAGYRGKQAFAADAARVCSATRLLPTPEWLHDRRAFGVWSLPDTTTERRKAVEDKLSMYHDFYKTAIDQNGWYGFWNYGDFMHAYDPVRHSWKYDVGGYAWDNTELGTNLWLWYHFLRTGDADSWRMAEAMARHAGEVDVYHIGSNAGLGSRHNVSHWGCGAKEARISQAAFNRFLYYLTCDERSGDLMTAVRDNDQMLYTIDPMRLAQPREKYPCTAPARLRIGPDWLAYAGNWMTEWERTGNTAYRDKILAGMRSILRLPNKIFTGPLALGYDPATGEITSECDSTLTATNHLMTIMGGFEVMNELMEMLPDKDWEKAWIDHGYHYKQMARKNKFRVARPAGYAAWQHGDKEKAADTWNDVLTRIEHQSAPPMRRYTVLPPHVPEPLDELSPISTNDAALWSLDAIYLQEILPQD